ncbi:ankyrin repeat-containing domain protein [Dunaliella salina]|uniref:Ankyrin repeat-containing domain protein n=1 Tax=Dunaliella salina TaxID=3046 RepID=A0ABQ7G4A2_DUNSA|nr:ankyrin repeat-containing domain protein [Dunaliella salina]|eukprot:KAF5829436.1 ankyrin repeat-containing domain protein [Dunaliella salina]
MEVTRIGPAAQVAESASIYRLPREVLLHALSYVDEPSGLAALSITTKSMLAAATDSVLFLHWLWKYRQPSGMALPIAACKRRGDVMLQLLKMGVSATARTGVGSTPLRLAVDHNLLEVVKYLWIERGNDVRRYVKASIKALLSAASSGHAECLQLLLTPPSPAWLHANSRGSWEEEEEFEGKFPLALAAESAHVEAVRVLLLHRASCAAISDVEDLSILHYACSGIDQDMMRARIVRMLLEVPEGVPDFREPGNGAFPLHLAAESGFTLCVEELCRAGSRAVNEKDFGAHTPFQLAGLYGNSQVQEVLLRYGADPNCRSDDDD